MNDLWFELTRVRADVVLTLGFILAVAATIHIVLTKREVASAVGWIGLMWFAPFMGVVTYLVLGINRVRRRARLDRPQDGGSWPSGATPFDLTGDLAALGHGIGRITGSPLLSATDVRIYHNGDEAYPPMLAAIAGARRSIGLTSYIFRDDQWGGRFIAALAEAKDRGVEVRVLIDGIGGGWLRSPTFHRLRRLGVKADRFMHSALPWRMPFVNLRSHKKILIVDGVIGFTGGMNIADENVMAARPAEPVQDLHFRIQGRVVGQLVTAFAQDWQFVTGEDLGGESWFPSLDNAPDGRPDGGPDGGPNGGPASGLDKGPEAAPEGGLDGAESPARVIDSGPDEDLEKIEFSMLAAISVARRRIVVMTPYFLPDERMITALSLAAMRGVDVAVTIPAKSNHMLVDWGARANSGPLLADGVRIWQSPSPFHHAKLMVVDDEWCLIGSCNWDIRSFRLNFELCVEVYDRALAEALSAIMLNSRGRALTQEDLRERSWAVCLRDAAARLMLSYL